MRTWRRRPLGWNCLPAARDTAVRRTSTTLPRIPLPLQPRAHSQLLRPRTT